VSDDGPASLDELDAYAVRRKEMFSGKGFYTDKLTGYCMLISRRAVERIGGFDERFYPGNYEDDDYSIRARIGGYRLWGTEDIFVHHEGQGTFRKMSFSYTKMSILNAERFRRKWNVGSSAYEIFFGGTTLRKSWRGKLCSIRDGILSLCRYGKGNTFVRGEYAGLCCF
jgi:GT2 family glycosyltransferase